MGLFENLNPYEKRMARHTTGFRGNTIFGKIPEMPSRHR